MGLIHANYADHEEWREPNGTVVMVRPNGGELVVLGNDVTAPTADQVQEAAPVEDASPEGPVAESSGASVGGPADADDAAGDSGAPASTDVQSSGDAGVGSVGVGAE